MYENFMYTDSLFKAMFVCYVFTFFSYIVLLAIYYKTGDNPNSALRNISKKLSLSLFMISFALATWVIVDRWISGGAPHFVTLPNGDWRFNVGRPPFKTFYESFIFACWTGSLAYIIIELAFKVRILGLIFSGLVVSTLFYALSMKDIEVQKLPPALQSPIFIPHVLSYFLAYGTLAIAFASAILTLSLPNGMKGFWLMSDEETVIFNKLTYEITKFGFFALTMGLVLGSWWGQRAWSTYWGWDPKENWALVSFFIFGSYFHFKHIKNWNEKKLSIFVIIGFSAILFTYVGMKYLPTASQSAHVYTETDPATTMKDDAQGMNK